MIQHVLSTLPDSISQRKRILEGLIYTAWAIKHPQAKKLRDLLSTLNQHELLQRELWEPKA